MNEKYFNEIDIEDEFFDSLKYINWKSTLQRQDIYVNIGSQPIVKNVLVTILITDDFNENDMRYIFKEANIEGGKCHAIHIYSSYY